MQLLQKFQIHIDKTPPQIHLQPPRIRLDRVRRRRRHRQQFLLVPAHHQKHVAHNLHLVPQRLAERLDAQPRLLVHAPLRVRHVLGDELPLPRSPLGVVKRHPVPLLQADDQRVKVRGGPQAQESEARRGVLARKCAGRREDGGGPRGFLHARVEANFTDARPEVGEKIERSIPFPMSECVSHHTGYVRVAENTLFIHYEFHASVKSFSKARLVSDIPYI